MFLCENISATKLLVVVIVFLVLFKFPFNKIKQTYTLLIHLFNHSFTRSLTLVVIYLYFIYVRRSFRLFGVFVCYCNIILRSLEPHSRMPTQSQIYTYTFPLSNKITNTNAILYDVNYIWCILKLVIKYAIKTAKVKGNFIKC